MRVSALISAAVFTLAGCSAAGSGPGDGTGGGQQPPPAGGGGCVFGVDCSVCSNCYEACLCAGGDEAQCMPACFGTPGGPPAPGGGGGPAQPPGGPGQPPPDPGQPPPDPGQPPAPTTYPVGPYGTQVGQTVREDYWWEGYVDGAPSPTGIGMRDLYDPDGSKGINAILFLESALWCGNCQQASSELNAKMAGGWAAKGVKVVVLVIEDLFNNPATLAHAEQWKNQFNAQGWSAVADPNFTFANFGSNGLPVHVLVNPRDMKIVDKQQGYSPVYPPLDQLLVQNGAF